MIYITGVSRGLGKAIAELYLSDGETVIGIGRSATINHPNFSLIECDLSDLSAVHALSFAASDASITLINNAGILGQVKRLSNQDYSDIDQVMNVNVSAPAILLQKLYSSATRKNNFTLVNISSGAANRAIPSWAAYCSSKAALNMFTETFYLEEREKGNAPRVYSIAPGVIDTGMQEQIRSVNPEDFSASENFRAMKIEGTLFSPREAAERLVQLLSQDYSGEVFYDLRKLSDQ